MDDIAKFAIGGASALIIVPFILFELRDGKVRDHRHLMRSWTVKETGRSKEEVSLGRRSKGISVRTVTLAIGAAALVVLLGILSGRLVLVLLGSFVISNVFFVFIGSRVVAARNRTAHLNSSGSGNR
jgi:hypothetical protein